MYLQKPDLTTGSRPSLLPDETLLFVQDGVGLYEGKYKVTACQKGHAYLTSHRVYYIDDNDARKNSLAIDLKEVEKHEYQQGFLRSSPKIAFHPKALRRGTGSLRHSSGSASPRAQSLLVSNSSPASRTSSPFRGAGSVIANSPVATGSWVCPICSFSNPVPSNFDLVTATQSFQIPPCLSCGIPPQFTVVLKAAVAANAKRDLRSDPPPPKGGLRGTIVEISLSQASSNGDRNNEMLQCPRCTFHNHPSLNICEMCGASLPKTTAPDAAQNSPVERAESPAPMMASLDLDRDGGLSTIKLSFRSGGDKTFYERLKGAMVQRKWILQDAPPIPTPLDSIFKDGSPSRPGTPTSARRVSNAVGIAGLEQRGLQTRKNNEAVLGTAFEDLEALMASAKDIVALAEKFARESASVNGTPNSVVSESAAAMGMIASKDMFGDASNQLYISELARNLAEYISDDRRGMLRAHGGIMSLIDLWARFNRDRDGVELVSPSDFRNATELWEKLGLPVRLRIFKSGFLAVHGREWTDDRVLLQFRKWLASMQTEPPPYEVLWDWVTYGRGVTASETAQKFGWSLGVATEELEMAEERGLLCREESVEGLKFWLNFLVDDS